MVDGLRVWGLQVQGRGKLSRAVFLREIIFLKLS